MMRAKYAASTPGKTFWLTTIALATCLSAGAQDYDAIIAKYKNEHAVITEMTEHLVITNKHGELTATTDVTQERLLISDQAPAIYNKERIYHSFFHKLNDYNAEVLLPSKNGGYKTMHNYDAKTKSSEDNNIFYDDSKETELSFTGLTKSSAIKMSYSLSHRELNMLPTVYFQENIPVVKSVYMVTAPKYVDFKFVFKGQNTEWIKQTKEESKNTVTYIFTATDIPAFKELDDQPSAAYYVPHIISSITKYKLPKDDKPTEMLMDPAHLYTYLYSFIKDVNVKQEENITKKVAEIIKDDKTDRDKAKHIYQWIQGNMHYVAFEDSMGGFIPRQAKDILERKFGDCKDMASILVAMYRAAGIDAHFTWIGTRDKPYTYDETPLPLVDNHMICAIKLDNKWVFIDGTDPLIPFGNNPKNLQDKEAFIAIDKGHYEIVKLPETPANHNAITDSTTIRVEGKKVNGKLALNFKGYPAWTTGIYMMYYTNQDRDKFVLGLTTRGSNKFIPGKYDYIAVPNEQKDVRIISDFNVDDYVQKIDKETIVNMNMTRLYDDIRIEEKDRKVPYFFKYNEKVTEVVTLEIPDGFHPSYVPQDFSRSLDGVWNYKISYKTNPGNVTLTKEYELKSMTVKPEQFAEHNKMIDDLRKQYKESVVLSAQ